MTKRVGIVALLQESNTFVPRRTTLSEFRQDVLLRGDAVRSYFEQAHHEVGGFFAGLAEARLTAVPIFAARALPSGVMTSGTFNALMEMMEADVRRAGDVDGILAAPHGATVSEIVADVDGYWLGMLRRLLGAERPILATLDPHANLSAAMVEACDGMIAYRTNPHIDQRQRGLEATRLMVRTLAGEVRPIQAAAYPPLAINIECQAPAVLPCLPIYEAAEQVRGIQGVLSSSICLGFPYADVPEMGAAALVVADGDRKLAERLSCELGELLWSSRQDFAPELIDVEAALDRAQQIVHSGEATGPTCLLDMGDNVGAGSPGDGTLLAWAIHRRKLPGAFVCLYDPSAAAQAASATRGDRLRLAVGGKTDSLHGSPLVANFTLDGVYEGLFSEPQPRHGGVSKFDQGRTAVVTTDHGLRVMLTSKRMAPWSLAQLTSCGLDPAAFRILAAKGVHSPIAAYQQACSSFIRVNTGGSTSADLATFDYQKRRRPMFPFEQNATWQCRHDDPPAGNADR
ncbi:MAG: M81 family metallopeptidase [Pirellulales bacterium]|nr:M81 family metallopeptidase [Pirellulales bacterium]